ncbi:MAG: MBL fold metallo-hydrolase [Maricaulaceae bacterium]|jgi:glyoxylase-like metal-dependent hydrolase (beta-lactamase superfamily II)
MQIARATGKLRTRSIAVLAASAFVMSNAPAQAQDFDDVEIITHELAPGLYYLEGRGGNIGVSVGEDGVFLVDDQFAPLTDKIVNAIAELTDQPVRFILNTHHHGDHVGGNANFGATGATIVAHENARPRIMANFGDDPVPPEAVPVLTFSEDVTFHYNGEEIRVSYVGPAHTDGDAFVHFVNADVIHTGDVFRTTSYPAADANGGGDFFGILDAYARLQSMMGPETRLLPGHGEVSGAEALTEQLAMIETIRERVAAAKANGASLEETLAMDLSADYDDAWSAGRWNGEYVVRTLYEAAE